MGDCYIETRKGKGYLAIYHGHIRGPFRYRSQAQYVLDQMKEGARLSGKEFRKQLPPPLPNEVPLGKDALDNGGVTQRYENKWIAALCLNGKIHNRGPFYSEEQARLARALMEETYPDIPSTKELREQLPPAQKPLTMRQRKAQSLGST